MFFEYKNNHLLWGGIHTDALVQNIKLFLFKEHNYKGSFFVYHKKLLHDRIHLFQSAFSKSKIYFSVKCLSNIAILQQLCRYPNIGLDVVSGWELLRALKAGFSGERIVFAGVGKSREEIELAIEHEVKSIHVESISELKKIRTLLSGTDRALGIGLRLNPDISAITHEYITTGKKEDKFGIEAESVQEALEIVSSSEQINLTGLHVHIGSQIMDTLPYERAFSYLNNFLQQHKELNIEYLCLGGGFGIDYRSPLKQSRTNSEFPLQILANKLSGLNKKGYSLSFEPGRFIAAPCGLLCCHIEYIKSKPKKSIAITNAGMSELIRPALYQSEHPVFNVLVKSNKKEKYDIVGPICETGDFLAKDVELNLLQEGDDLIVTFCGAYASSMSSNYNSRPLVPEVLMEDEDKFTVIRKPQSFEHLIENESF